MAYVTLVALSVGCLLHDTAVAAAAAAAADAVAVAAAADADAAAAADDDDVNSGSNITDSNRRSLIQIARGHATGNFNERPASKRLRACLFACPSVISVLSVCACR